MDKLKKLKTILKEMSSVVVAYSGGVDSTFLLKVAKDVLGGRVLAVTAVSPTYQPQELSFAKKMTQAFGVRHNIIKTNELKDAQFVANPLNRCYFCKKELFSALQKIAQENALNFVVDASNLSDKKDFRPGAVAKQELKVRSPLQEAALSKEEIRHLSKRLGLKTWNKPSLACLASRIPYGTKIKPSILKRINKAELFLMDMGFKQVRLRHYNGLCRIEVCADEIPLLIRKRKRVIDRIKRLGYNYITLDLEGYRTGSLNEVIKG